MVAGTSTATTLLPTSGVVEPTITYFGSASVPTDNGSNATTTLTITPPGSMTKGMLVFVTVYQRGAAAEFNIGNDGGQSWNRLRRGAGANTRSQAFWCVFDGTWDANPAFTSTAGTNTTAVMHVFSSGSTDLSWVVNVPEDRSTFSAPSTPFEVSITGQTTTLDDTVTIATWATGDDNTWGTLTGTGWAVTGSAQYRNLAGSDSSLTFAHKIQTVAGATGDVSKRQATLGGDAGYSMIVTFGLVQTNGELTRNADGDGVEVLIPTSTSVGRLDLVSSGTSEVPIPTSTSVGHLERVSSGTSEVPIPTSTSVGRLERVSSGTSSIASVPTSNATGQITPAGGGVTGSATVEIPIPTLTGIGRLLRRINPSPAPPQTERPWVRLRVGARRLRQWQRQPGFPRGTSWRRRP